MRIRGWFCTCTTLLVVLNLSVLYISFGMLIYPSPASIFPCYSVQARLSQSHAVSAFVEINYGRAEETNRAKETLVLELDA